MPVIDYFNTATAAHALLVAGMETGASLKIGK
jgi:hypothetical protein